MTGAHHRYQAGETARRSPLLVLLWLLTALTVLQWTAPAVDPLLFARLSAGGQHEADLAVAERQSPAVEARAASSSIVFEKRSPGGRSLPLVEDVPLPADGWPLAGRFGRAAVATSALARPPRFLDSHGVTARGPPATA